MLCLLVIDQDFEIIEVALTVIAPRPVEDLLEIGVVPLLLGHRGGGETSGRVRGAAYDVDGSSNFNDGGRRIHAMMQAEWQVARGPVLDAEGAGKPAKPMSWRTSIREDLHSPEQLADGFSSHTVVILSMPSAPSRL
jgi:hypothetical protein